MRLFGSLDTLRVRALVGALLVVLGLSVAYTLNASRLVSTGGRADVESGVRQMAEILNVALAPYANAGNLDVAQDYLEGLLAKGDESGLVYVVILSDSGEAVMTAGSVGGYLPSPDVNIGEASERGLVHVRNRMMLKGNRVGALQFGFSTKYISQVKQAIQLEGLVISAAIGVLVLAGVLVAGVRMVRRIDHLVAASQEIAAGNYRGVRADETGLDEIALLARNFNRMADAVSSKIAELETSRREVVDLNAALEDKVAERTRQLALANSELAEAVDHLQATRETLIQSEKLAGLGAVVAGVAHELNTPIGNALTVSTAFEGNARKFRGDLASGVTRSALQRFLDDCVEAADLVSRNLLRAADLLHSFKQVATDQSSEKRREFALLDCINEHLALLGPMLKRTPYAVEIDIDPTLRMKSFPGAVGQSVSNFINNALLHAFEGRSHGRIAIKARRETEGWIRLEFSDDGRGIAVDHLKKIFDPFFTTRFGQGGSGLGLNIVFNLVTGLLGGSIEVDSREGEGTTFVLVLPECPPNVGGEEA